MKAVKLWDIRGTRYEAAGMQIETGPQLPYSHDTAWLPLLLLAGRGSQLSPFAAQL